ncbi:ribonuclease activity regulator RraA [Pseudomonas sp. LJDD11]|uniref:RraA family protein n=1 Tax=unclassified Pseudomonas TaxID=196821 RepID=UPI0004F5E81A|nr:MULTISPECIES: dimethylmenaquinone methyltransferase [unclassified Pseudomonas]MCQ9424541.1 ribonuclease activity regulator RraA [Pseudomonas sp. LJDD11]BAP43230.1 demethylmenaquinone methyltransferase [Pseudomonas sp. StFLB209]
MTEIHHYADSHEDSAKRKVVVSDAVLAKLATCSSGSLTTQLFKLGFRQPALVGLRALSKDIKPFAGRAYTMRFIPAREDIDTYGTMTTKPNGDNLQWQGVEQVQPGDVLVIDSQNDPRAASAGNILVTRLIARGAKAIITDGALRDGSEVAALPLPAYAREVTATTRISYHHVADLQVPIGCAGVAVYPGDVIVGDADGLTVIPAHLAEEVAEYCSVQDDLENYLAMRIAAGEALWGVYPPSPETVAQYHAWIAAGRQPIPSVIGNKENP